MIPTQMGVAIATRALDIWSAPSSLDEDVVSGCASKQQGDTHVFTYGQRRMLQVRFMRAIHT